MTMPREPGRDDMVSDCCDRDIEPRGGLHRRMATGFAAGHAGLFLRISQDASALLGNRTVSSTAMSDHAPRTVERHCDVAVIG